MGVAARLDAFGAEPNDLFSIRLDANADVEALVLDLEEAIGRQLRELRVLWGGCRYVGLGGPRSAHRFKCESGTRNQKPGGPGRGCCSFVAWGGRIVSGWLGRQGVDADAAVGPDAGSFFDRNRRYASAAIQELTTSRNAGSFM